MVWYATTPNSNEIFVYDGTTVIQVTNNIQTDYMPEISNSGQVVWYETRGSDGEGDYEVFTVK